MYLLFGSLANYFFGARYFIISPEGGRNGWPWARLTWTWSHHMHAFRKRLSRFVLDEALSGGRIIIFISTPGWLLPACSQREPRRHCSPRIVQLVRLTSVSQSQWHGRRINQMCSSKGKQVEFLGLYLDDYVWRAKLDNTIHKCQCMRGCLVGCEQRVGKWIMNNSYRDTISRVISCTLTRRKKGEGEGSFIKNQVPTNKLVRFSGSTE